MLSKVSTELQSAWKGIKDMSNLSKTFTSNADLLKPHEQATAAN